MDALNTFHTKSVVCVCFYLLWYLYDHFLRMPWLPSHYNINIIKVGGVGKDTLNNTAERSVKKSTRRFDWNNFLPSFYFHSFKIIPVLDPYKT